MKANKRIEEFIMKLFIRQNETALYDIINELNISSYFNNSTIKANKSYNKYDNESACCIDKKPY
jgi:hypothetical protein